MRMNTSAGSLLKDDTTQWNTRLEVSVRNSDTEVSRITSDINLSDGVARIDKHTIDKHHVRYFSCNGDDIVGLNVKTTSVHLSVSVLNSV